MIMKNKISIITIFVFLGGVMNTNARENVVSGNKSHRNQPPGVLAGCSATTAQKDLDINNVRARVLVGGDMWWDLVNAQYEIPKGSAKTSLYAGALWIGGIDAGGQIKVAAQTYRQTGNDMWAGPITLSSVTINSSRCLDFDKVWRIRKEDVLKYQADPGFNPETPEEAESKQNITNWPGNGRQDGSQFIEGQFLAPFYDQNGNGLYEPSSGDVPKYIETFSKESSPNNDYQTVSPSIPKIVCDDYIFGDQTIWWVFNDVGNIHTETNSEPIGMEVRAQAFAFKTNDEINDMTFYHYQVINRSTFTLTETYFGQWVDPDLGDANDDYVGCDVKRGLGFVYNADADDGGATGYGLNPPACGIDFFEGPKADLNDGVDNDRDGCTDCTYIIDSGTGDTTTVTDEDLQEQIIMAKFVYYNNVNSTPDGNPDGVAHFYNYLRGVWGDGLQVTYGGDGRDQAQPLCNFMFPGTSDPAFPTTPWTEVTAANIAGDRRFLQSAGKFTLEPGAVNYITTGVVWKKAGSGGPLASVELMKLADDKAQALFNNCFKLLDGPDAPDVVIRELDQQLIFSLQNTNTDKVERYDFTDVTIIDTTISDDAKKFKFQGYQVYQVKDATVTVSDLKNPDKARLLFQCDLKDTISRIINFTYDPAFNATVPTEEVNGKNLGIAHTFKVEQDLFATGNTQLINHKTYFYTAVSYAYNNYRQYYPDTAFAGGQQKPYLAGRNNIKTYTAIPHIITPENNGTVLNSEYGDGPVIKRIEGQGNGGIVLDFTEATANDLISSGNNRTLNPEYIGGHGPIDVKVYDPLMVKGLSFTNKFSGVTDNDRWTMIQGGTSVKEDTTISQVYEQIFAIDNKQPDPSDPDKPLLLNWGISASIHQVIEAGKEGAENNGFLEGTMEFSDNTKRWLTGVHDAEGGTPENWIRSGLSAADPIDVPGDVDQIYEGVINGTWAPFRLTANDVNAGPKPPSIGDLTGIDTLQNQLSPIGGIKTGIESVDLVITADQSKWSRAAVIEMGETYTVNIGGAYKFNLRKSSSIGKNGEPDNSVSDSGMSWFPGYAYSLETGERLNIAFGENSSLTEDNSRDMKWNPSTRMYDDAGNTVFGGMHYIYIFGHSSDNPDTDMPMYDQCQFLVTKLDSSMVTINNILSGTSKKIRKKVWKDAMWVNLPLLVKGQELLSSDVKVRLRVARSYRTYAPVTATRGNVPLTTGQLYYVASDTVIYNSDTLYTGASFTALSGLTTFRGAGTVTTQAPQNGFNPMYTFSMDGLAPNLNNNEAAKDALKLVNIVPNPYYAYSAYEGSADASGATVNGQLDNRIKITNLPAKCTVSIFTMSGVLIRRYEREVQPTNSNEANQTGAPDASLGGNYRETSLDWDLKNSVGITVSSGIYLIHVSAPGIGERTLKWFGVLRPVDLDTF